jgi:primary-amine oxidase
MGSLGMANDASKPHPLAQLSIQEVETAREVTLKARSGYLLLFRDIFAAEPAKAELVPFLESEHSGRLVKDTPRPRRLASVQYDAISDKGSHAYTESLIDVDTAEEVLHRVVEKEAQPPVTLCVAPLFQIPAVLLTIWSRAEFKAFQDACVASPMWKEAIAKFNLPEGFSQSTHDQPDQIDGSQLT